MSQDKDVLPRRSETEQLCDECGELRTRTSQDVTGAWHSFCDYHWKRHIAFLGDEELQPFDEGTQ